MLKIDIISGFLGAGKTTLIRKLFESEKIKNEKVVIIENEFGEIGIDGAFLKDAGIKIKEINAGCICCSLVGDFEKSIIELNNTYHPDRIIIEPSGVGKLSDIIAAVNKVKLEVKINMLVTVVDTKKVKMYLKNFGEFFNNQVLYADTIVLAKVDTCKEENIEEAVELIKQVNEKANIITTNINELDANKLVDYLEEKASLRDKLIVETEEDEECDDPDCCCHHHHHDHEEHECCHHHEHHHDDYDEDEEHEHECCHHHHEEGEEHECCHHHHDEEEHECCHHDHDHHEHHHHHGHDADEVFTSWGIETPRSFTINQLEDFLKALCENNDLGIVLRSKGILKASDNNKWYYFDLVAGDYQIRLGEPDYTGRVVVIGSHLNEDKVKELFLKR